jgi:YgiT-type zinc finger domain-containing protein
MKKGEAAFHIDRKGCHVTLARVPAWVCAQCSESYFAAVVVAAIQELAQTVEQKTAEIVQQDQRSQWLAENNNALLEYNRRIESHDIFSEGLRQF